MQRVLITAGASGIGAAMALAVYLASPTAKAISGQAIPIDNDRQRT